MNAFHVIALALDPGFVLRARGIAHDGWQQRLLLSEDRQILLNCSRQSGKSTTVAALALHTGLCRSRSLTLLLSPSLRQSIELFRKVLECYSSVRELMGVITLNQTSLEFRNHSRIVCLPGREETIRSFSGVNLLVIDEAARVPDDLYRSVRPMLAVSRGRLVCLSTPFGRRGFFYEEWAGSRGEGQGVRGEASEGREVRAEGQEEGSARPSPLPSHPSSARPSPLAAGSSDWLRVRIPWQQCPRISRDFIEVERRSMGESWIRQEYECSFEALEGLVYPDFEEQTRGEGEEVRGEGGEVRAEGQEAGSARPSPLPSRASKRVGGIDFGFRNPFCALWGVLDQDDVLWISDERYVREAPLHEHVAALKRAEGQGVRGEEEEGKAARPSPLAARSSIMWYADPAGRTEIEELRHAGLKVIRGSNSIAAGIAAVNARLRTGRLRVRREGCPNLLAEAKLYRYGEGRTEFIPLGEGETSKRNEFRSTRHSEIPIDQHNHALAALRYLVSRLDAGFVARFRKRGEGLGGRGEPAGVDHSRPSPLTPRPSQGLSRIQPDNDELWSDVGEFKT
jgi:hypothetical protein